MKKIIFAFIVFTAPVFAQTLPEVFELNNGGLRKIQDENPAGNSIEDIVVVGDTIWLATGNGLSRSMDNGLTWKNYYNTEPFGTEGIARVAYHNHTIWASTWHLETQNGSDYAVGTGLKYSTDKGETWASIPQPVDEAGDSILIYGENKIKLVTVKTNISNYVRGIAFTDDAMFIATLGGGIRKSIDNGATWQRLILPPDTLYSISPSDTLDFLITTTNLNHIIQSVTTDSDNAIYVGTSQGLNKSEDGGISWTRITHDNQENSLSGDWIIRLKYNDFDKAVWAASWRGQSQTEVNGASVTYNGGQTWSTFLPGIKPMDFGFVDKGNSADNETIAATEEGIFRTNNKGASWAAAPEIFDDVTRVKIPSSNFRSVAVRQTENANYVWLGSTNDGLARITESGPVMWAGEWKVYLASGDLETGTTVKAFPNPFAPLREKIKIQFSTNNTDTEVSIRIFDFGMNLVKTLLQNAPRTSAFNEYFEFWDGRNEKGKVVPNGVYFYRVDIGNNDPLFGKIMVLN